MSGCQRLWTISLSCGDWVKSTLIRVSVMPLRSFVSASGMVAGQTDRYLAIRASSAPSTGSSWTRSPFSRTSTRSAMSRAKDRTCSETTMDRPFSSRMRFRVRPISRMIEGWMPSVGSSRSRTLGREASARAIASCCCWPPDRLPPRRPFISRSTGNSS
ncbi:hypothetical protein SI859A1_00133 [Aurantimonas manganoxydans SI85-9A1]|uniref:Uncharacterized protein n=1 Tax=Aurantimonas manganoxydans (strain ATCC BAA-1229 / DSM 21871 / SI85-9A1) TaxID=287752 RepID=Q1YDJ6_AURMS|nr:hypothetical protein SI859A1_00133 [Aurantimonas manganoxydans SI85-9A1]